MAKITLESGDCGTYLLVNESGDSVLIQTDWDYAPTASLFGWVPCKRCRKTDGTVACKHRTVPQMLEEARSFLDDHVGDSVDDPGYFS